MLTTYKALLRGNRLDWSDDVPPVAVDHSAIPVYVTILSDGAISPVEESQGQRMAAALEQLAAGNAFSSVPDAAAWERETRRDRELPGRES